MSDGCKIKKTDNIYSIGYNTQQSVAKIYCEEGSVATVPSSPIDVVATPGNGQISLTWTAPNDGGSAITDYKIEYSSNGFIFQEFSHSPSSNTSITVTGLTNGTLYIFRVSAINAVGTGNPSGFSNAVRPFTTPSAPSIISLVRVAGSGVAISVSWSAPSSNGGSPILEYKVEYSNNSGASWSFKTVSANILSTIVDTLANGQSYIFRLVAINAAGATFSDNSAPITPATVPSAPTNVVGTIGDSQISLTWSAPSSNGGLPITDYKIQYNSGESWETFSDGTSTNTSAIVTGLTNGQSYIFRVIATNAVGDSIESINSSEKVPGTTPNAPTIRFVTAQNNAIQLSWDEPTDNGGYGINYYSIIYSSDNGSTWTNYPDLIQHISSITNTIISGPGITNGNTYIIQVKATNDIGSGPYSASSNPVTPVGNASCISGPISHDYVLAFIDEAHPLYVVETGNVGSLWGADLLYYNNILSDFPTCATILFDVDTPFVARGSYKGQPITSDPFYIFPTGVNSSQYTQCKLPIDNITGIARPSGGVEYNGSSNAIGSISANTFATGIVNAIETFWGSDFWNRMANSYHTVQNRPCKLWITRGHTISLGSGVLSSGIEIFKNYAVDTKNLNENNIDIYINTCGERYLGWIPDVIQSQGNQDSCRNMTKAPNIFNIITEVINNNACANNPGDRLVKFYFDPPDYPNYPYPSTCSGTEALDDRLEPNYSFFYEGLSLRINSLFSCSGILNSEMVAAFSDPNNNNNKLAEWNFYSLTDGMSQNPANRSFADRVYEGKVFLSYENNVPYVTVGAVAWDDRLVEPTNSVPGTYYVWKSPVPLDSYGVPNGIVDESSPIVTGRMDDDVWVADSYETSQLLGSLGFNSSIGSAIEPGTGIPQFPNMRFQSSPCFTLTSIPGSECISINS